MEMETETQALDIRETQPYQRLWHGEARNALLVVMTLVITLTFQVGVNPPWGSLQDDKGSNKAGTPTMKIIDPTRYWLMAVINFWGFIGSSVLVVSLLSENQILGRGDRIFFTVAFSSLMVTYGLAQFSYGLSAGPFMEALLLLYWCYQVLK